MLIDSDSNGVLFECFLQKATLLAYELIYMDYKYGLK